MPSVITEHQVWPDTAGQPIVNGKIYIGTQNADPVANPITIYSDRALSVSISNPQSTDAYGRATNKIWVPAKYSIRVDDSADVQQYQELDAGDPETTGITTLTNVLGTDTITADGAPTISALADNQQYNFRAANTNTGAVTLQIDLTTAKTIKKQHDVDLVAGDIEQNQTVSVIYNATDDTFEMVSNVSVGDVVDLNVSNDFTYKGVVQSSYVVPAAVTNHTRAGNTQLLDGGTTGNAIFNVGTSLTEATWESIGPTGSGANNIWAELDVLPASATILIVDVLIGVSSTDAAVASISLYAADGDVVSPTLTNGDTVIGQHSFDGDAATTSSTTQARALIPLGPTNQDFQLYWFQSNTSSQTIQLFYRGFMTDA